MTCGNFSTPRTCSIWKGCILQAELSCHAEARRQPPLWSKWSHDDGITHILLTAECAPTFIWYVSLDLCTPSKNSHQSSNDSRLMLPLWMASSKPNAALQKDQDLGECGGETLLLCYWILSNTATTTTKSRLSFSAWRFRTMRTLKQINQSISSCHSLCRVISCSKYTSILLRSFASTAPITAQGQSNTVIKYKNNVANPWSYTPAFTMVEQRPCLASSSALANLEYRLETRTREKSDKAKW